VAKLHAIGHVQEEEQRDDSVYIRGRFPPAQAALYGPFVLNGANGTGTEPKLARVS